MRGRNAVLYSVTDLPERGRPARILAAIHYLRASRPRSRGTALIKGIVHRLSWAAFSVFASSGGLPIIPQFKPSLAGNRFRQEDLAVTDRYLFTSESVSMGHPDKVADQISDAVLDHCLKADPTSRVACETMVTTDLVILSGEITTRADLSRATLDDLVRAAVAEIGYTDPHIGFAAGTC